MASLYVQVAPYIYPLGLVVGVPLCTSVPTASMIEAIVKKEMEGDAVAMLFRMELLQELLSCPRLT